MVEAAEPQAEQAVRRLIARSGRCLDARDFATYLDLYTTGGRYRIEAYSEEVGQQMTWLSVSRKELAALLAESPEHIHDLASRSHLVTVDEIGIVADEADVLSSFVVFRTTPSGETGVYAVGDYIDRLKRDALGYWRIADRCARVKTRMFAAPTPMPL